MKDMALQNQQQMQQTLLKHGSRKVNPLTQMKD